MSAACPDIALYRTLWPWAARYSRSSELDRFGTLRQQVTTLNSDDVHALRFTILRGARTAEVIGAEYKGGHENAAPWGEFGDVDGVPTWGDPEKANEGQREEDRW